MAASAADQLCLDVSEPEVPPATVPNADLVGAMIDAYRGDYRAAIEALLDDADFLRDQLYTASCLMSKGIGRGWKPKYERL
jgi:hypothetical protein